MTVSILMGLLIALAGVIWYMVPKSIHHTVEGVKYRLGIENKDFEESVTVNINGKMKRNFKGERIFTGTIHIENEEPPVPVNQRELVIKFFGDNSPALIAYRGYSDNSLYAYNYGTMYTNTDMSEFTIEVFEESGSGGRGWNGGDGLMISAPASDRTEALEISNRYFMTRWKDQVKPLE
ncbi:hypothetical protein SAMN05661091_1874 [Paenibacillus uliginis N3/975]|uniref:Uncharacterized protein n=1 Tax=Paenibacillus uliginis N3/975 TaxID=1313296 RepID=A0A1X7H7L2_9BACL|nr:hypothetical protein [Paenibacillus uliginis]SMF80716.1 hypothetical protein SAMN05661091_1874 [Paenibacillus uliginis N3/975]